MNYSEVNSLFNSLPVSIEGESKCIKRIPDTDQCIILFKPTIYSFTSNRAAIVDGSSYPRVRCSQVFKNVLELNGIYHAYQHFYPSDNGNNYVISKYIETPPNIEVVGKAFHTGNSKHKYYDMNSYKIRNSHLLFPNFKIENDAPYPHPMIRFDWRNPFFDKKRGYADGLTDFDLKNNKNYWLEDQVLTDDYANWFIDVKKAKATALKTFSVISDFLNLADIVLYDICMFIDESGEIVFGEISPDCGRFRRFNTESLDKDVWRAGGSSELVLEKWNLMADLIEKAYAKI